MYQQDARSSVKGEDMVGSRLEFSDSGTAYPFDRVISVDAVRSLNPVRDVPHGDRAA